MMIDHVIREAYDARELTTDELNVVAGGNVSLGGPIKFDAKQLGEAFSGIATMNSIARTIAGIIVSVIS